MVPLILLGMRTWLLPLLVGLVVASSNILVAQLDLTVVSIVAFKLSHYLTSRVENIAAGTGDFTITDGVVAWTNEVKDYDASNPGK